MRQEATSNGLRFGCLLCGMQQKIKKITKERCFKLTAILKWIIKFLDNIERIFYVEILQLENVSN